MTVKEEELKETVASEESQESEKILEAAQEDVGSKEAVAEEEKKVEDKAETIETISKSDYEKLLQEKKELEKVLGRQGEELGRYRKSEPTVKKEDEEVELSAADKLNLLATDPSAYEARLIKKAKKEILLENEKLAKERRINEKLISNYPDVKNPNSELSKMIVQVIMEEPEAYTSTASVLAAAEIAKNRLAHTDEKVIEEKARAEALKNVKKIGRETAMETKPTGSSATTKNVAQELLGRELSAKEQKFLDQLGVSLDSLQSDVTYDTVVGGKKK